MNVEQEARDLLNKLWTDRGGVSAWNICDQRHRHNVVEAVCRALEAHDEVQAAFDAYRREVSDKVSRMIKTGKAYEETRPPKTAGPLFAEHCRSIDALKALIIPEPVDPLTIIAREMVIADGVTRTKNQEDAIRSGRSGEAAAAANEERLRAALAKIGGKVMFEGEGA